MKKVRPRDTDWHMEGRTVRPAVLSVFSSHILSTFLSHKTLASESSRSRTCRGCWMTTSGSPGLWGKADSTRFCLFRGRDLVLKVFTNTEFSDLQEQNMLMKKIKQCRIM